eukprot:CAMPEP_0202699368 /NCGR_PEP_ID=MMETSP1385-20130828/12590_1 /ASSEMBLY_ACC=CAM_ASM_000861 /TAXON_ID=933848 /ORGANISM="Elphidium margaritaceum" /LENGTH=356 /DNA_ID=CAMNT_0049356291 /DNA_START=1 /DNA_END=1067 /DNA_ORIENTATION=+
MRINTSKTIKNGIEEYRWHYDSTTCTSFIDKLKVDISIFYGAHLLFHGVLYAMPLFLLYLSGYLSYTYCCIISTVYLSTYLFHKPFYCLNNTLPWYPDSYKRANFWEWMKFYVDWLVIRRGADELYQRNNFLFAIAPHGILAVNRIQMMGHMWFDQVMPAAFGRYAAAWPQFFVPGVRETSICAGAVDASKSTLDTIMKNGESIYLWPGGTKELLTTDPDSKDSKMVIYDRYGFIKMALIHGIDIVPVMQFGEKWLYKKHVFHMFNDVFYKYFKTPAIIFFGRWCTMIPFGERENGKPIRMGMVVDTPIKVPKIAKEEIDFETHIKPLHFEYIQRMKALFDTYKKDFHYDDDETLT